MRHVEENTGIAPCAEQVSAWYEQQPENTLLRAKGTAENALQAFSEKVYGSALEDQEDEIRNGIVVAEIRQLRAFWPQFGVRNNAEVSRHG